MQPQAIDTPVALHLDRQLSRHHCNYNSTALKITLRNLIRNFKTPAKRWKHSSLQKSCSLPQVS